MKTIILRNWNIARWLRLFIGIAALVQGILQRESVMLFAGGLLVLTALLNMGCCGSNGCPVPVKKSAATTTDKEEGKS